MHRGPWAARDDEAEGGHRSIVQGRDHPCIELACDRARPSEIEREAAARVMDACGMDACVVDACARAVRDEFPTATVTPARALDPRVTTVWLRAWRAASYDPQVLDAQLAETAERGALRIRVVLDDVGAASALVEILSRAQPYVDRRNEASRAGCFDSALAAHYALHDLDKPLVRADYAHALDVWQWTLRLDAEASLAVQLAALYHDVERLESEADRRIEHHAADYAAFKRAHARAGGALARRAIAPLGLGDVTLDRVAALVGDHETPGTDHTGARGDRERALLNDADALSFFSLNSAGFFDYYGAAHTRAKIAYTLGRASCAARERMRSIRLRADVAALLDQVRGARSRRAGRDA